MADKVQKILEDVLTQSIYLVKKGIFSEGELKRQMTNRERLQNNLVKKTIRTTDYLKAIQYEYEQERIRKYRQSEESDIVIDPKYKRASTKDFTILKRAIRLWDRTMHKYRFRIDLWKQYLAFCHSIKSKKAFYKALTNATRFNPFSLQLWLSGAYYEFEVIKNPWKARKIFHKALKLNKINIHFWKQYLRFECEFADLILKRQSVFTQQTVMKFEGEQIEHKLGQIDFKGLLTQVIEASLEAIPVQKHLQLIQNLSAVLSQYSETQLSSTVNSIQTVLEQKIKQQSPQQTKIQTLLNLNYPKYLLEIKETFEKQSSQKKLSLIQYLKPLDKQQFLSLIVVKKLSTKQKLKYFSLWSSLMGETKTLHKCIFQSALKQLSMNQQQLSTFILSILPLDSILIFRKLINQKLGVSPSIVLYFLQSYESLNLSSFQMDQLIKRVPQTDNSQYLRSLVDYNLKNNKDKDNLKLLQSLKISKGKDSNIFNEISKYYGQKSNEN